MSEPSWKALLASSNRGVGVGMAVSVAVGGAEDGAGVADVSPVADVAVDAAGDAATRIGALCDAALGPHDARTIDNPTAAPMSATPRARIIGRSCHSSARRATRGDRSSPLGAVFLVHVPTDSSVDVAPAGALGGLGTRVASALGMRQLPFELAMTGEAVGGDRAAGERRADRAAGLAVVATVAEPAARGDLLDGVERHVDAVVGTGNLECADPGRVDEQGAAGEDEQFAMRRRVPAPRVVLAHRRGRLAIHAKEPVDE